MLAALALTVLLPCEMRAQCPDGTPPPCGLAGRGAPRRPPPPPAERARHYLLLPFRNVSGGETDAWLVHGAQVMLADALGQWRELAIVPDEQLSAVMRRRRLPADVAPDADQIQQLARETGGWTAVTGDIVTAGGVTRISARAIDVPTRRVLVRSQEEVPAGDDVRRAFDRVALRLLEAAGLEARPSDLAGRTTQSIDAYRAYVRGLALTRQSAFGRAHDAFAEAVRLDSSFAQAWARLAYASSVWSWQVLLDPRSDAYREAERAAALAPRLPERDRELVLALASGFRGQFSQSRRTLEQLVAADSSNLDALELLSLFEVMDPILDTTGTAPRLRGSLNRATRLARRLLELDPERRHMYAVFLYAYGTAGGVWGGGLWGYRREAASLVALFLRNPDISFVPVLRDSFVLVPSDTFYAFPRAVRDSLRRRAADAAATWVERWVSAGPGDAEAWMWAMRIADLRQDYGGALRALVTAESLGVESRMENPAAERMHLLLRLGRHTEAAIVADSLAHTRTFIRSIGAPNPFQLQPAPWVLALLLETKRWGAAFDLAAVNRSGTSVRAVCRRASELLNSFVEPSLNNAVADTVLKYAVELQADSLGTCVPDIAYAARRDSAGERQVAGRFLVLAESLSQRGDYAVATRFAHSALIRDTSLATTLRAAAWYLERVDRLRYDRHFVPRATFSGDSLVLDWEWRDHRALVWDDPEFPDRAGLRAAFSRGDTTFFVGLMHWYPPHDERREGAPSAFLDDLGSRSGSADVRGRLVQGASPTTVEASASDAGVHVVVRGAIADAMQRLRPAMVTVNYGFLCLRDPRAVSDQCRTEVPVSYR